MLVSGALIPSAGVYTDIGGLTELRARARGSDPKAAREAATQIEAMFLQMMLKSMRAATPGDPIFGSDRMRFYRDMFDQQISLDMARKSSLGLGDALVRQLGGKPPSGESETVARTILPRPAARPMLPPIARPTAPRAPERVPETGVPAPSSPRGFVDSLWSHARRAGEALGVAPELLVAQAALETGWGRAVIRGDDGASSHNLFGIKAHGDWHGARVIKSTLEYRDGAMRRVRAPFRAYRSFAEGFEDYVRLVSDSPRYRAALGAANPSAYMHALQDGGYATDPAYADKVLALMPRVRALKENRPI